MRLLCVHSTGAGKTRIAKAVITDYLTRYPKNRVLCVAPLSVKGQFIKDIEGPSPKIPSELLDRIEYISYHDLKNITHYDKLKRYLVIMDEVHTIKNPKATYLPGSQRYSRFSEAHKVLMLTATPISTDLEDLRVPLEILWGGSRNVPEKITEQNLPGLLYGKVSVFQRPVASTRFPFQNRTIVSSRTMSKENTYKYLIRTGNNRNIAANFGLTSKFNDFIKNLGYSKKVIAYFEREASVKKFANLLRGAGIGYSAIDGQVSNRKGTMDNFLSNSNKRVMLLTKAGESGLNFVGVTQIHFIEMPNNYITYMQVVGRGIRQGQHHRVRVFLYKLKLSKLNQPANMNFLKFHNMNLPTNKKAYLSINNRSHNLVRNHASLFKSVIDIMIKSSIERVYPSKITLPIRTVNIRASNTSPGRIFPRENLKRKRTSSAPKPARNVANRKIKAKIEKRSLNLFAKNKVSMFPGRLELKGVPLSMGLHTRFNNSGLPFTITGVHKTRTTKRHPTNKSTRNNNNSI
jgi:superfamily II DNA or RNA helicase